MERSISFCRTAAVFAMAAGVACSGVRMTPPAAQAPQAARIKPPCSWQHVVVSRLRTSDVLYDIASVDDYSGSYEDNFTLAVGGIHDNSLTAALEYLHHRWLLEKAVNPSSTLNVFYGASADKYSDIWTVGEYFDTHNRYEPLAERFNGKAWSQVSTPGLGTYGGYLTHVNVMSPADVWMDGVALKSSTTFTGLLEHWDGHRVQFSRADLRPQSTGNFQFSTAPIYLGSPSRPTNQVLGLNEDRLHVTIGAIGGRGNPTQAFSVTPILPLKGYPFSYVNAIVPYDTNGVLTFGYYQKDVTSLPRPMAQWWDGKRFDMLSPPSKGLGASLLDAAYSSQAGVLAVGVYDQDKKTQYPYALAFNGKEWRDAMAPQVAGVYTAIAPIAGTKDYWVAFNGNGGPPGIYLAKCNSF
jgi:hypothetical protein